MEQTPPPIPQPIMQVYKQHRSYKKILLIIAGIMILGLAGGAVFYLGRQYLNSKISPVSNTALDPVTQNEPLYDFSGVIEQVNSNILTVSETIAIMSDKPISAENPLKTKKVSYKVQVTSETKLSKEPVAIGYSLKLATASADLGAELSDFKAGRRVNIVSKQDFKKLTSDQVQATSVTLLPGVTVIQGTVKEVSGNLLVLHAVPPSVVEEKDYKFTLSSETEIVPSYNVADINKSKTALPRSALKIGVQIIVQTDTDVNFSQNLPALKIDVLPNP